jgi:uncharacterized protein (UPF0335 family)
VSKSSKVVELAKDISNKYHEVYMEANGYSYDTSDYKDLLSEFIDFADTVERMLKKKSFWKKLYFW